MNPANFPAPAQGFPPLHDLSRVPRGPVLVVAPHPDDEIIGCGGAIALHRRRGDAVTVALVTGGEGGGRADVRLAESRRSAAAMGGAQTECLGVADGGVARAADLPARLAALVARLQPAVVYAPSPFEMHPDHVATLHAVAAALLGALPMQRAGSGAGAPSGAPLLLLYEVNTESMASFLLDISAVVAEKRAAMAAFASQHGLVDITRKTEARALARTVNVDLPAVTHAEAYLELPAAQVAAVQQQLAALAQRLGLAQPSQPSRA
ncbi:MAG: PIG-L deacetylase family protein [Planctomycetota bacterium]